MNLTATLEALGADIDDSNRILAKLVATARPEPRALLEVMDRIDALSNDECRFQLLLVVVRLAAAARPAEWADIT
jgi:hypothetical protein